MFPDDSRLTNVICSRTASKKVIATFFGKSGYISTAPLEDRRTVNALWYTTISLSEVNSELRKKEEKKPIIFNQDYASSHTALLTIWIFEA